MNSTVQANVNTVHIMITPYLLKQSNQQIFTDKLFAATILWPLHQVLGENFILNKQIWVLTKDDATETGE